MKKYNQFLLCSVYSCFFLTASVFADQPAKHNELEVRSAGTGNEELTLAAALLDDQSSIKAFKIFLKYAERGNAEAEASLGNCYYAGIGTSVDYSKAYRYYFRAAQKNNPQGLLGVGFCKQFGHGTRTDLLSAINYYKKAADMNFPPAVLHLAKVYADQEGGYYDEKLSEEYFKKAIALNAKNAKNAFAAFLITKKRYDDAFVLLDENTNDVFSLNLLIQLYENGWGTEADIKKAISLRERVFRLTGKAQGGDSFYVAGLEEVLINGKNEFSRRCFMLGAQHGNIYCMYEYALLLKASDFNKEALDYMIRAADAGYDFAQLEAGKMLRKTDPERAAKYFTLATLSQRTRLNAVPYLSVVYRDTKNIKQQEHWNFFGYNLNNTFCRNELAIAKIESNNDEDFALAVAWFGLALIENNEFGEEQFYNHVEKNYERLRKMADAGNSNALFVLGMLGCLYDKNHQNVKVGMELLLKSAEKGNAYACHVLGNIYKNGKLVKKDLLTAIKWFKKGAELKYTPSGKQAAMLILEDEIIKSCKLEDIKEVFELCISIGELSVLYEYGLVMEDLAKDKVTAEKLYRSAAKEGDTRAMVHLYRFLRKDNLQEAQNFLIMAAERRDGDAELILGDLEFQNNQPRAAFSWYMKAYEHSSSNEALAKLAFCWLEGYGCNVNMDMFRDASAKAFKEGSVSICLILGCVYMEGKVVPKDLKKARFYFEEGKKRGDQLCAEMLTKLK